MVTFTATVSLQKIVEKFCVGLEAPFLKLLDNRVRGSVELIGGGRLMYTLKLARKPGTQLTCLYVIQIHHGAGLISLMLSSCTAALPDF